MFAILSTTNRLIVWQLIMKVVCVKNIEESGYYDDNRDNYFFMIIRLR